MSYQRFPLEFLREPSKFGIFEMNIFYLDEDPAIAAMMHCDKHVVKMILETAQILSTAWHGIAREHEGESWTAALTTDWEQPKDDGSPEQAKEWLHSRLLGQRIYNRTHENHPCAQWARLYGGNYDWLYRLGMYLLDEYRYRYGKTHATAPVLRSLELVPPPLLPTLDTYCDPPACMPEKYVVSDVTESYKRYYRGDKQPILIYTRRPPPSWCADIATFKEPKSE